MNLCELFEERPIPLSLKDSLRAHLEQILNTRATQNHPSCQGTVVNFGLGCLSGIDPQSSDDQKNLTQRIKDSITAFEPRLRNLRIQVETPSEQSAMTMKIRIFGSCDATEMVFEAGLIAASRQFSVRGLRYG